MIYGDMKHYANGRKKPYNAYSKCKNTKSSNETFVWSDNRPRKSSAEFVPSLQTNASCVAKIKPKQYTGSLIKGISTMHKSNLIPVTDENHIKEISKMRR